MRNEKTTNVKEKKTKILQFTGKRCFLMQK